MTNPNRVRDRHTIFQSSLIGALLDGVYEGELTVGELLEHGDFGLGTFDALDGEMVIVDSRCYRLRVGGVVSSPSEDEGVPFALVTEFVADLELDAPEGLTKSTLAALLANSLPSQNYLYAARITGAFHEVAIRNVVRQTRPFKPLDEVTKGEPVNLLENVSGVMVGFQTPAYERGIGVPGGHLHFIDDERKSGGHVLDFKADKVRIDVCVGTDLLVSLPTTAAFMRADLDPDDLDSKVESAENHS